MVRKTLKWFLRIVALLLRRGGDLPHQSHLVPALEPQSLLRESFRRRCSSRSRSCSRRSGWSNNSGFTGHNGKLGDASPAHQQRDFDRAKTKPGGPARLLARSANAVAAALHPHSRLVHRPRSRGREVSMAQLSGEPAFRGPERIPVVHGEPAPAAGPARLRVLPAAARRASRRSSTNCSRACACASKSKSCRRVLWSRRC